jgi:hypothetical protein
MGDKVKSGFFADVLEMAVPVVLEQNVTTAHGSYEEILVSVIVYVFVCQSVPCSPEQHSLRVVRPQKARTL